MNCGNKITLNKKALVCRWKTKEVCNVMASACGAGELRQRLVADLAIVK
jgi:hypothetical protein